MDVNALSSQIVKKKKKKTFFFYGWLALALLFQFDNSSTTYLRFIFICCVLFSLLVFLLTIRLSQQYEKEDFKTNFPYKE
jgi:hypothetical protein